MNKFIFRLLLSIAAVCVISGAAFAQGRGRGNGNGVGRRNDVFADNYRNRGRKQDWKCGKFVNCHDARDGRVDGRRSRNDYYSRGSRVGYRRYSTNDYWRRRHLTYDRYNRRRWDR